MTYRFEELDVVRVSCPDVRNGDGEWYCQIFRVPLAEDTVEGVAAAREEVKRKMEHHFENGLASMFMSGSHVVRSSAGYAACKDPVLMLLRPEYIAVEDGQMFLVAECGLMERPADSSCP